jgi:hypothetical protein
VDGRQEKVKKMATLRIAIEMLFFNLELS